MTRLMISGFAAIALLAAAATMLRSHSSTDRSVVADKNSSQAVAGLKNLRNEEFEDMSLVYSRDQAEKTAPLH